MTWLSVPTLTGTRVTLRPLALTDAADLAAAVDKREAFRWTTVPADGTGVNPGAKLLLLQRAFEDLGAVRVVWHTDERNAQSRAGIAKLGATFEGLLRKHKPLPDGSWRTTAQFAMTDDDWPATKVKLEQRVQG